MKALTVGEVKKALEWYPDDMLCVVFNFMQGTHHAVSKQRVKTPFTEIERPYFAESKPTNYKKGSPVLVVAVID